MNRSNEPRWAIPVSLVVGFGLGIASMVFLGWPAGIAWWVTFVSVIVLAVMGSDH